MKDYYAILNLKRFASMGEVRRAYRQLVQQYHPDVNPDPSAAIIIREINEAYEVLGDVRKKRSYDHGLITPYEQTVIAQPEPTPSIRYRDPYFRRKTTRPVFIRPRQYDLIVEYFYLVKVVSAIGLGVCLILLIDYSLPKKHSIADVTIAFAAGKDYIVTSEKTIAVTRKEIEAFEYATQVELIESRLLGQAIEIRSLDGAHSITSFVSIYGIFKFVPIIVLVTSMICLLMRDNLEFRFGLGVLTAFSLFCMLMLMLN